MNERIKRVPKGSRLRTLFESSDSEDESECAGPNSQTTWTGSQPPPSGIQTQEVSSYKIPRKHEIDDHDNITTAQVVLQPSPKPSPPEIIIMDTPDSTTASRTTVSPSMHITEGPGNQLSGPSMKTPQKTRVSPRRQNPPRVSLSPAAATDTSRQSRTNNVSSLEALAPPPMMNEGHKKRRDEKEDGTKTKRSPPSARSSSLERPIESEVADGPPKKKMKRRKDETQPSTPETVENVQTINDCTTAKPTKKIKKDEQPELLDEPKKKKKPKRKAKTVPNEESTTESSNVEQSTPDKVGKEIDMKATGKTKKNKAEKKKKTVDEAATSGNVQNKPSEPQKEGPSRKNPGKETLVPENQSSSPKSSPVSIAALPAKAKEVAGTPTATAAPSNPKPKKKKRTFQDQVLAEMLFSCKAYNLKTLAQRLKTTEVVLHHLMLSLLDKRIVIKKSFTSKTGKVKDLYWANQESKAKEIQKLIPTDEETIEAQQELETLRKLETEHAREMSILTQELSNDEVEGQLQEMEAAVTKAKATLTAIHTRIRTFKEQQNKPTRQITNRFQKPKTAAQLAKERCPRRTKMRINALRSEWKSRKEKCMDFVDQLADGMEKKPKDIVKLLDIETDEMEGVTMPPKHVIEA